MPGKRAPSAKAAKSTASSSKTRSNAHAKPKAGTPKLKRSSKTSKDAQKARDADARDNLNGADDSLRAALLSGGKETEVVVKAVEKPTELLAGGDQLAAMLTAGMGM